MKKFSMVAARFRESMVKNNFPNPDRTAYRLGRSLDFDYYFQVWPNRQSMARSIRMQQSRPSNPALDWIAVIKLSDGEGY